MAKSKADGYAPRCLVAEATAMQVQTGRPTARHRRRTSTSTARAGTSARYKCPYTAKTGYTQAQCVKTGKDANTARFRLVPNG